MAQPTRMVRHPATRRHPPTRAAADPQSPTQPRPRSRPGPLRIRQDIRRRSRRHLVAQGTRPSHRHHHPTITAVPKQHTTPSFPSFAIIRILVQTSTNARILSQNAPCDTTTHPSPKHPLPQQPSPLPRAIPLPLPRGRLRGGPRVRATGRPRGPTTQTTIPITATTNPPLRSAKGDASTASRGMPVIHPNTPPQKPNHQPVSQFVPQFKTKPCTSTYMVLPNCTSHFYLTATALLY